MVGDPSGKRDERPVLSVEVIDRNALALRGQLAHFLDFEGPAAARVMNNADWLRQIGLMEFLRDMEMIKQMEMLQNMEQLENTGEPKITAPQKTPPAKNRETVK